MWLLYEQQPFLQHRHWKLKYLASKKMSYVLTQFLPQHGLLI